MKRAKGRPTKRRTVQWEKKVDDLAVTLAAAQGYYPEKSKGGVSKFLADLVLKAKKRSASR